MGTIKTKEMLVDVARKIFAEKGVENTTMNDIAQASQKGRRTLYTYFKNKDEIYYAVIETELSQLANKLQIASSNDDLPNKKLIDYIFMRLDAVKEVVNRNGNLNADFFLDIKNVERVRRKLDFKEKLILRAILREGVEKNIFKIKDVNFAAQMIHFSLKGFEVPYIRGELQNQMISKKEDIANFIMKSFV